MNLPESRKLTGLIIVLVALLVLCVIAIVAVALFGIAESLFAQIGGFISAMGAAHQTAQAAADRSPNYPNIIPPASAPPPGPSPPDPGNGMRL